jgi:hypothetical protein
MAGLSSTEESRGSRTSECTRPCLTVTVNGSSPAKYHIQRAGGLDREETQVSKPVTRGIPNIMNDFMLTKDQPAKMPTNIEHLTSSRNDEWYTPGIYIEAARKVLEQIDLDPASRATANQVVKAAKFYDREQNGLRHDWPGRVFLNPPYRKDQIQTDFVNKLIVQYRSGITTAAILSMGNRTETDWFTPLWDYPLCFTNHRIEFYSPDGAQDSPVTGNVFVYLGPDLSKFIEVFSEFGTVVGPHQDSGSLITLSYYDFIQELKRQHGLRIADLIALAAKLARRRSELARWRI